VRTLIDIASVAARDEVEEALDDALRRGIVSISRLRWRLDGLGGGRTGVGKMRALIDARDPSTAIPESVLERKVLRMLRGAGLPQPLLQHQIRKGGRLVAVVDFAYPELRLAIEADGYRWHSGRARWKRDRRRGNNLTLLGWRVIHVTWDNLLDRSDAVVDLIRRVLAARR
jgi:very-short-patch-repair endonuclease